MNASFFQQLSETRLLPVATVHDADRAVSLARAVGMGGAKHIEITLRTDQALAAIARISAESEVVVGAGTVLNEGQCVAAIEAGAAFVVSPGLDEGVVETCLAQQVACLPGVATASELQKAYNLDLETVKWFPAEASGGVNLLKALAAPFPEMRFVPTGGIGLANMRDYLAVPQTLAIGGSWMVADSLYAQGDFSGVTELVKQAVAEAAAGARVS